MPISHSSERHQIRYYFSSNYLYSAYIFAQQSLSLEKSYDSQATFELQHRSYVVSSIMSAVAFLEAVINELYSICAEEPFNAPIKIGEESIQKLGAFWQIEKFRSSSRTLEKHQVALQLMNKPLLDIGSNIYQDANLVIRLRNLLVHYKPELQEIAVGKGIKLNPDKIAVSTEVNFLKIHLLLDMP